MTEYIPPDAAVFKEGHYPNTEVVTLELHRLLAIFLSSRSFAELRTGTGETWEPISHIQQCEDDEITRILLAIAITARVIDDREEHKVFDKAGDCGTLSETETFAASDKPLSLREACNKIIHAQKVRFDISETETRQSYLNPIIYLYGQKTNKVEWKATIDIIEFSKKYAWCIGHF